MDQVIKELWATALESGEYEQGRGALHNTGGGYCCLGVLCDLAVKAGAAREYPGEAAAAFGPPTRPDPGEVDWSYLPAAVQAWAGLDRPNPQVAYAADRHVGLAHLNDDRLPFPEIAKLIREQL